MMNPFLPYLNPNHLSQTYEDPGFVDCSTLDDAFVVFLGSNLWQVEIAQPFEI